ncbi:MAG: protein kinase [Candidatus Eisenbacteria bacterium]|uniref:Protein kinase n=1 Tax=Eiseniibacteriota bacterium TaxID=2212470 RepID=A0A956SF14_UNCEI|nr:protein kinase [Candidatus Eisenbacteria bacterium]
MRGESSIDRALDAIADGTRVDWDDLVASARSSDVRDTLEELRVLSRVQELAGRGETSVPTTWGTLEVVNVLGRGTFGTVFRARDPALDLEVALKVLHPGRASSSARLLEEGRCLAKLRHPNIVRVFGVDEMDGRVGLRMELVRGRSLAQIVEEDGPLGHYEAMRVLVEVCRALAAVHAAGLVHRDVKAQNVIREDTGRIVLMDFGAGGESTSHLMSTGMDPGRRSGGRAVGTPLYLAPELIEGDEASRATDIYSAGVLLFHLLSGEFPIEADDLEGVRRAHDQGSVRRLGELLPGLPPAILHVVDRALATEPHRRHADAEDMARELARALVAGPVPYRRPAGDAISTLPVYFTSFVGRRDALEEVAALVRTSQVATLYGPGGSGKTRLVVELVHGLADAFPGGVWFVPLAPLTGPEEIVPAIASALGARDTSGTRTFDAIVERLSGDSVLVVLDNCEHVLSGVVDALRELMIRVPDARFLVTSREPMRALSESTYSLPPLALALTSNGTSLTSAGPSSTSAGASPPSSISAGRGEAAELFVQRARSVRSNFPLDEESLSYVDQICHRLDGLPLAVELAAARVRSLTLPEILRRLGDQFQLLRSDGVAEPRHHQTLLAWMEWSHDLLSDAERAALEMLAVFCGGWTLRAAEFVLAHREGCRDSSAVDLLTSLVDKSLVQLDSVGTEARYGMLETVRSFALGRVTESERREVWAIFLDWCLDHAAELHRAILSSGVREAMTQFSAERDNLIRACRLSLTLDRVEDGLRIVSYMGRYWLVSARWREGRWVCEMLLAHPGAEERTLMRAAGLSWLGVYAQSLAQPHVARPTFEECLAIRTEQGDAHGVASALNHLGVVDYDAGDYERAREEFGESLSRRRELGEKRGMAQALTNLALCDRADGRLESAIERLEEALLIHRELGNEWGVAKVTAERAFVTGIAGDHRVAIQQLEDAIRAQDTLGPSTAFHCQLGQLHLWRGDLVSAKTSFHAAIAARTRSGEAGYPPEALHGLGLVAHREGDVDTAMHLLARASATRRVALEPRARAEAEDVKNSLRATLGEEEFESKWKTGEVMPVRLD